MFEQNVLQTLFVAFAFISQALLIFNFAALGWKPHLHQKRGSIVYASGLVAFPLGIQFRSSPQARYFWFAFGLFKIWPMLGYFIDILRPINWRDPIRWQIFVPYVVLYISAPLPSGFHCGSSGQDIG
jgi:hypothetical protein